MKYLVFIDKYQFFTPIPECVPLGNKVLILSLLARYNNLGMFLCALYLLSLISLALSISAECKMAGCELCSPKGNCLKWNH